MSFVTKWGHEIGIGLLAVWAAIGTAGQTGLLNLAATTISHHTTSAAILTVASIIIARLRPAPSN